jgi:hypothetical protein
MALIHVEAFADTAYAAAGNNEPIQILMSIVDSDGKPYTELNPENFSIKLMFDTISGEFAEVPPVLAEPINGIYQFSFDNADGGWGVTPYVLIIHVFSERTGIAGPTIDYGQTMVHFQLPATQ